MQFRRFFLPKTLLGRTVLVLILVVAGTQLTSQWVFERFVRAKFTEQIVRVSYTNLLGIYNALSALPPSQRADYARRVSNVEGFQIIAPGTDTPAPSAMHDLSPRQRIIEAQLKERVMPDIRMVVERDRKPPRVWLALPIDNQIWYVRWQRHQYDENLPLTAVVLVLLSVSVAIVVAWQAVRKINTPLRAVQGHILRVSDGTYPPLLPTTEGPEEIDALNRAVNKMAESLQKADSDRALILAGISHDVRTPLARLGLALELLQSERPDEVSEMRQDIEEIDGVIGQFLDFARQGDALRFEHRDLSVIALQVLAQFEQQGRAIAHSLTPGLVISLYESQVRRLISNLLENAWRYGKAPIELHTYALGDAICLSVLDRGPGIPEQQIARVRQPFTRLEEARSGVVGSGLGLAIVDRIALAHQAEVDIRNRAEGGLEVRVRFPKLVG